MAYLLPFYTDYEGSIDNDLQSTTILRGVEYKKYKYKTNIPFYVDGERIEEDIFIFKNKHPTAIENELKMINEDIIDYVVGNKKRVIEHSNLMKFVKKKK